MASIASPLAGPTGPTTATSPTSTSNALTTNALGNETTFLQLLVSEIKNQDPTAPMDSTTFLTQLAQFSQLEQMSGIRQDIETGKYQAPNTPSSAVNPTTPVTAATKDAVANLAAAATPASLANTAAQDLSNTALTTPASTSGI
ncbi:MAG TPA: flagellar hook capping FlgD N-terminal domain-containing protein [Bryobacteraceae bacterium]|nr:flagellar hook capping FlgD N-terminal domain-containing protein [Bryobacteraceae bacterium]